MPEYPVRSLMRWDAAKRVVWARSMNELSFRFRVERREFWADGRSGFGGCWPLAVCWSEAGIGSGCWGGGGGGGGDGGSGKGGEKAKGGSFSMALFLSSLFGDFGGVELEEEEENRSCRWVRLRTNVWRQLGHPGLNIRLEMMSFLVD